jgi:hypothetical protein
MNTTQHSAACGGAVCVVASSVLVLVLVLVLLVVAVWYGVVGRVQDQWRERVLRDCVRRYIVAFYLAFCSGNHQN